MQDHKLPVLSQVHFKFAPMAGDKAFRNHQKQTAGFVYAVDDVGEYCVANL